MSPRCPHLQRWGHGRVPRQELLHTAWPQHSCGAGRAVPALGPRTHGHPPVPLGWAARARSPKKRQSLHQSGQQVAGSAVQPRSASGGIAGRLCGCWWHGGDIVPSGTWQHPQERGAGGCPAAAAWVRAELRLQDSSEPSQTPPAEGPFPLWPAEALGEVAYFPFCPIPHPV